MSLRSFLAACCTLVELIVLAIGATSNAHAANCCPPKPLSQAKRESAGAKEVLPPNKFFGRAALGYSAAKQAPEVCAKLFCYCGCDLTDSHANLLDCFTCEHGVDCQICQEEAIIGLRMKREGKNLYTIQKAIDRAFSDQYPWDKPSAQLLEYRKSEKPEEEPANKTATDTSASVPDKP